MTAFFTAFLEQWLLLLGGGVVSVVFVIRKWWRWRKKPAKGRRGKSPITSEVVWPLVGAAFFACALAWNQEHSARLQAEQTAKQPKFWARVEMSFYYGTAEAMDIYALGTVINEGPSSIAGFYNLVVTPSGGVPRLTIQMPIGDHPWGTDQSAMAAAAVYLLSATNDLGERTVRTMATGAMQRGWLRFRVIGLTPEQIRDPKTSFSLTFADYQRHPHAVEWVKKPEPPPSLPENCDAKVMCAGLASAP